MRSEAEITQILRSALPDPEAHQPVILIAYHLLESRTSAHIEWIVNELMSTANKSEHKDACLVMLPTYAINP